MDIVKGSRFEILDQGDADTCVNEENVHVHGMVIETEEPMDLNMEPPNENLVGVHTSRATIGEEPAEKGNELAKSQEVVRNDPILEGRSSLAKVTEAGRDLNLNDSVISLVNGNSINLENPTPIGNSINLGNPSPVIVPKISGNGIRTPLSSLNKGPNFRNSKFKKGSSKKPSRLGIREKETLDSVSVAVKDSRKFLKPLESKKANESLASPHLSGVQGSPGHRSVCGRANGRSISDGGSPVSEQGEHRGELIPAA